jgi:hypothetical protein
LKRIFTFILLLVALISFGQLPPGELELRKIQKLKGVYIDVPTNNLRAAEQDCNNALAVCQSTYTQPVAYSGHGSEQEVPTSSCLGEREKNSVWYIFTVQSSGTLTFTIDPNVNSDDYDFALYNITGRNCSDIKTGAAPEVRCNYCVDAGNTGISAAGSNASEDCCTNSPGCQFSSLLNVTVGQTYVLIVSNYTSSNSGYSLTFGGTAAIFDNVAPRPLSTITPCGVNYMTVQMSESILCSSIAANGSDFTLTGPGGPFTMTGATGINCGNATPQLTLTFTPQIIIGSTYTLTLNTGGDGNTLIDNCSNQAPVGTSLTFTATPPNASITGPTTYCAGGSATLVAGPGASYVWSNGATTQAITVSPLVPTTYTVTITNGTCVQSASHTVNVKRSPTANFTFPSTICAGQSIQFTNTSTYLSSCFIGGAACVTNGNCGLGPCVPHLSLNVWEFGTGATSTAQNPNYTFTNPGTYTVSLTVYDLNMNCNNRVQIPVTVVPSAAAVTITGGGPICSGGSVTLTANNGSSYVWSSNPVGFTSTNATITVSPTTNTTYTVTSPGCSGSSTASTTINVSSNITPTFNAVAPICAGGSLSPLPTTSTNGITGSWSPALNNSTTTLYTFTPTAGQCATTTTMSITVNSNVTPTFSAVAPICAGGSLSPLPTTSTNGITGSWTPALNNSTTTLYTFTPTAGQCATTTTMSITVNSNVTPTFNAVAPICAGGSLSPLPTTSTNGITGSWSPALNNSTTTLYTFTPTAGQCATTTTMSITVNSNVTPTFSAVAPICAGGSLSPLPTSSTNGITGSWTPALNNSTTTLYTFTPTAGQCATTTTMSITVNSNVTPTFNAVAPICAGGSLSPLPTTSTNGITGSWTPALNNGATTLYTFTPTAGQCATTTTMSITVNSNVTPTFSAVAPICAGGSLSPLPTTSTNGITGSWTPALNNSTTTLYTFTPTAGQCATTTTMSITVNSNVTPTFSAVAPICAGGSLSPLPTTSTNGITGSWTPALNNSTTTLYTFTPTAGQCATTTTMSITVNSNITPTFNAVAPICAGGSLSPLPTTSTNGITGSWTPALNNSTTTLYTFTPTAGQCATTTTMSIVVNQLNAVTVNTTTCNPANVGTSVQNLLNQDGCDSVVTTITTLNASYDIQLTATTCDPLNAGVVVQNLVSIEGCDSIVTTTTTLLPSDAVTINTTTCNPANVGTTVQNLLNQDGCDSVVTTITTLNASYDIQLTATTCNPLNAGVVVQNLVSIEGCDSIVTTTTTLLPSDAVTINATTCNPANVGTSVQNLLNQDGCDSVVTTITTLNTSYDIQLTATTCNPLNAGVSIQNLVSIEGCDSIVTTTTTLLPSDAVTINATTCNPANVGTTVQNLLNQDGCDSVVTTITTLNASYDIQLTATTCNPLNAGVVVQNLVSIEGCDSIVTTTTTLLPSDAVTVNTTTCNPANVGTTVQNLLNQDGCDSVVTTITTLNASYNIQLTATTCDPLNSGVVVQNLVSIEGCDSIVTTTTTLLPSDAVTINATTCNPANVGTTVQNLLNQDGCDSVVTTITTLNASYNIQLTATTCDPLNAGVVVQNLVSIEGCDSIVTTTTMLLPSDAVTINATTCNPANVGTSVQNLLNQDGCDSVVTTITTLNASYDIQLTATTCDPLNAGVVVVQNLASVCD